MKTTSRLRGAVEVAGIVAVILTLVIVGYELRQNTSQLRAAASYSMTQGVNSMNAGVYNDSSLAAILINGERDYASLDSVQRMRFDAFQFSRLNLAEHMLDLEAEGVSELNFSYVDHVVRRFRTQPGLQDFISTYEETYVGSEELLSRLTSQ